MLAQPVKVMCPIACHFGDTAEISAELSNRGGGVR
jgi:hypothetical protein